MMKLPDDETMIGWVLVPEDLWQEIKTRLQDQKDFMQMEGYPSTQREIKDLLDKMDKLT